MNAREAEKLLGGYATGTLTEAERAALFTAALEDQELFNALADEETLRELLGDPVVKARLLAALEPKVVPLWRRPAAMTLAASLLVAVGATLMLKHGNPERMLPSRQIMAPSVEEAPAPPPEASLTPAKPHLAKRAPKVEPPAAAAPAPPAENSSVAGAASTVDVVADQAQAGAAAPMAKRAEQKAERAPSAMAMLAPGLVPTPSWAWDASGQHLSVTWGPSGFLYLIQRGASGARLLEPTGTELVEGRKRSVYSIEGDGLLDLYWTNEAPADPLKLPAEDPIAGFHARLSRPGKKQP